jgi:quercetin dioxygenase-like cupin family protein
MHMSNSIRPLACLLAAALLGSAAWAQTSPAPVPSAPGFASKPLHSAPLSTDASREATVILVTLAPGATSPSHTHPGDCVGFVVEGSIEMRAKGQPVRRLNAGDAYSNMGGVLHEFTNVGTTPVRLVNTLITEKGKPRSESQSERP